MPIQAHSSLDNFFLKNSAPGAETMSRFFMRAAFCQAAMRRRGCRPKDGSRGASAVSPFGLNAPSRPRCFACGSIRAACLPISRFALNTAGRRGYVLASLRAYAALFGFCPVSKTAIFRRDPQKHAVRLGSDAQNPMLLPDSDICRNRFVNNPADKSRNRDKNVRLAAPGGAKPRRAARILASYHVANPIFRNKMIPNRINGTPFLRFARRCNQPACSAAIFDLPLRSIVISRRRSRRYGEF